MDLDDTQALDLDEYDDAEEDQEAKGDRKQVGQLKVFRIDDLQVKIYDIYEGENFIGRDERSDVYIPRKSLSKTHACIEVSEDLHLVYDDTSKNKTRRDKMILKPQVRYELHHGDILTLADARCQYFKGKIEQDDDDTASETGSESMLPIGSTTHAVKDTSKEDDPFAADTESETDDEKNPVNVKKPTVHSSDENLAKQESAEDSDQPKPIVPAFMYDSNDDDDDDDKNVSKTAGHKSSSNVKAHMDVSADSGTLAFGLVSPDDMTIIRPPSRKIPEVENTPLTLVYSPDTQDRTPDNPSIPTKTKDEGNSYAPTLIYGNESPYQESSPVKVKLRTGRPECSAGKDFSEISTDDSETPEKTCITNVPDSQTDIATLPVHEIESLKETPLRDVPDIGASSSCKPTLLYGAESLEETPLKDIPDVGETPSECNVYLPETQGFSPGNEETSFCEPTQAYLQESPVNGPKETPEAMVSNISDSEGEREEEEKSQSDSEVKKVLTYDDSATQAYTWNDSDATDDENDELRYQATQAYPSHVRQPENEDDDMHQGSSPAAEVPNRSPCASSSPHVDMQQTLAYGPQSYSEEVEDLSVDHAENKGKGPKDQHMEIEPTLPYDLMEMETQAYEAETEETTSPTTKDGPSGSGKLKDEEPQIKEVPSTGSTVKGVVIEPTLPYEILETETQDFDSNEEDSKDDNGLTSMKDPAVEQTVPYDIEMETQAYGGEDGDDVETDDEDSQERTVFENKGQNKKNQEANVAEMMQTQAYGADVEQEGDDVNTAGPSNIEDAYGETQAYGLEEQVTSPITADEVIPDSDDILSQEIPFNKINKDEDKLNNNVPEKTPEKQQITPSSDKQEIGESSKQEEAEIIIRPTRRGRGRVTQPSAEEEKQPAIPLKPDDATITQHSSTIESSTRSQRKGKKSLHEPGAQDVKAQRSTRGRRSRKNEVEAELKDTFEDEKEKEQLETAPKRENDVREQSSRRGSRLKASEAEDTPLDVADEDQKESASVPKKRLTRGRRSKKGEAVVIVEDVLDDAEEDQKESASLTPVKRTSRGRRSKKSQIEAAIEDTLPDTPEEDQSSLQPEPTPDKDLPEQKPVRGRRSKKKDVEREETASQDDTAEDQTAQSESSPEKSVQQRRSARGTRSKKKDEEALVEETLQDKSKGNITSPSPSPKKNVEEKRSARGTRSKKKEEEAQVEKTPIDDKGKPNIPASTPEKNVQGKRSARGTRSNKREEETQGEETQPDDNQGELKSVQEKRSTSRTRSKKSEVAPKVEDVLPDSEEEQFALKKGKGKTVVPLAVDQDSSGMDEELPSLELILSSKKAAKGKGKAARKTKDTETPDSPPKKDSPTGKRVEDKESCSEPVVAKPFFSRRGRGRVTQSDDSLSAVPVTSESDMAEFKQEDLMSPHSVAKSIATRKGKNAKESVTTVEKETEVEFSESQVSTSSPTGSKTRKRGKGGKTETITTELNESQSGVTSSGGSKTRGKGRGKTTKVAQLDDTHLENTSQASELSESQSSNTSSVESKTRGKGRRRTGKPAPALDDTQEEEVQETPSKKHKTAKKEDSPTVVHSPSLRGRKHVAPKIMFTGVSDKQAEKIVTSLGGTLVDSVHECTHLITDKVRRTVKFLCGVASGQTIVQPQWLTACKKAKHFIEPEPFIVSDKAAERQYSFSLQQSLEKAQKERLLECYKVHITKNVKPEPSQMKDIIKCAKGEYLPRIPRAAEENVLVISCEVDQDLCKPALACGLPVYSAELLLTGILRQELQLDQNRLFVDEIASEEGKRKRMNESEDGGTPVRSSASRSSKRKKK